MTELSLRPDHTAPTAAGEELRLHRELAAVYRLVAHSRMTDLIFTHISVRLPGPEQHFLRYVSLSC